MLRIGLALALLLQVGVFLRYWVFEPTGVPLVLDQTLPYEITTLPGVEELGWDDIGGCSLVYICTTSCPWCSALIEEMRSSEGELSRPIFLVADARLDRVENWANAHGLSPLKVGHLGPTRQPPFGKLVFGKVWVTPLRVILSKDGRVRDARPASSLPELSTMAGLCTEGGIAPATVQEFIDYERLGG
jgi:hypothetical protein